MSDRQIGHGDPQGDRSFHPDPDVVAQRMGEEVVLVHLRTNRIYELNPTGARCWELLTTGLDRAAIRQQLLQEYAVEEEALAGEIDRLLAELRAAGLVHAAAGA